MVTIPMVPCPHIGKQPDVSKNNMEKSLFGSFGGKIIPPLIIS